MILRTYLSDGLKYSIWTKLKTALKEFEVIWSAKVDHIISNFLKTVFLKFYLVHS